METLFTLLVGEQEKPDADYVKRGIFFDEAGEGRQDIERDHFSCIDAVKQPHQYRRKKTVLVDMEEARCQQAAVKKINESCEY